MRLVTLTKVVGSDGLFTDGDWIESKDQDPNGDVRLVQLADIGDGHWVNKSSRYLTTQKANELKCTFIQPGDILLARMPDPLGRACIFPGDEKPCVVAVDICIIRPEPTIVDSRWLLHRVNSTDFRFQIASYASGTTRQRISRSNLAKIEFELPPLAEQKRIARILDVAAALQAQRRATLTHLDTLLQSTFLHMFGDPVTNPMRWPVISLGNVAKLKGGYAFKSNDYVEDGIPLIRIGEVNRSDFDSTNMACLPSSFKDKLSKFIVKKGTILMSLTGTTGKDDYGNAVMLTGNSDEYFLNQRVAAILPDERKLTSLFLCYALKAPGLKRQLTGKSRGIRQANISNSDVTELSIPVPPMTEQHRFEAFSQRLDVQAKRLRASVESMDSFFQSLQQRAFRGELSPSP